MEVANKLVLIFVVSLATIIPLLEADVGYNDDDVWQKRQEEAKKNMMRSYVPNPLLVTEEFDSQVD
ncbi:hypothetical protein P3X46_020003, partial [Hevea brasiliensis]